MIDRVKVIKGLECCIIRHPDDKARCDECPYESACCNRLKNDALALLKTQETVNVDAVPVTWLKAHSREYYEDWGEEPVAVEDALSMWQKEQEG